MIQSDILKIIFLLAIISLSKCDYFYIPGFETFEESLFQVGYWSMPHGSMFNCCYFPLPYEFSLAMGISVGVTFSHFSLQKYPVRNAWFKIIKIIRILYRQISH